MNFFTFCFTQFKFNSNGWCGLLNFHPFFTYIFDIVLITKFYFIIQAVLFRTDKKQIAEYPGVLPPLQAQYC